MTDVPKPPTCARSMAFDAGLAEVQAFLQRRAFDLLTIDDLAYGATFVTFVLRRGGRTFRLHVAPDALDAATRRTLLTDDLAQRLRAAEDVFVNRYGVMSGPAGRRSRAVGPPQASAFIPTLASIAADAAPYRGHLIVPTALRRPHGGWESVVTVRWRRQDTDEEQEHRVLDIPRALYVHAVDARQAALQEGQRWVDGRLLQELRDDAPGSSIQHCDPSQGSVSDRSHAPPGSADCWCEPDVLPIGGALVIVHHRWRGGVLGE